MDSLQLLRRLVSVPGPPGLEEPICAALQIELEKLGVEGTIDAKGNLHVLVGSGDNLPVVTAHMDEIAMIVRSVEPDGSLRVGPLGGLFPWKLGEGPVFIMGSDQNCNGVLSFGSIHTDDETSTVRQADTSALDWNMARIITGMSAPDLELHGIRPGTRVVVHPSRRKVVELGNLIGSYFLDDRADLVSWLGAIQQAKEEGLNALFIATAAEEVGGEGALYALQRLRPEVCIALELGPNVVDAPVEIDERPTLWVNDSYSAMRALDIDLVLELGIEVQLQALSRGGSDASCAASHGLCARPFTLGLPMENSHGFEVMHPGAMDRLTELTIRLLKAL